MKTVTKDLLLAPESIGANEEGLTSRPPTSCKQGLSIASLTFLGITAFLHNYNYPLQFNF